MNRSTAALHRTDTERLQARWGAKVAAALSERELALPHEIGERLRAAREQALARARSSRRAPLAAVVATGGGTLAMGGGTPWWVRLANMLPLLVLAGGLVLIQDWHAREQVLAAAQIDAMLLADTVPPDAYADPGFVEFLKEPLP